MNLQAYVDMLRAGGVLACPTETQVGLLADALNERAVQSICAMKQRPPNEPIPLIVPSLEVALELVRDVSAQAIALATQYWPGPLTLVLRGQARLPAPLLKNGNVALRIPGPSPALDLVTAFGAALTATSANLSGLPPLSTEITLRATFGTSLAGIVSGLPPGGLPSTIVDVTGDQPIVLRQGAIVLAF